MALNSSKMEQLLIEQKAEIEDFNRLYIAFVAEKIDELSIYALKAKIIDVNRKFEIIAERNQFIQEYKTDENKKQSYFVKSFYTDIQALNAQFVGAINEAIKRKTIRPKSMSFGIPDINVATNATENAPAMDGLSVIEMQKTELEGLFDMAEAINENS